MFGLGLDIRFGRPSAWEGFVDGEEGDVECVCWHVRGREFAVASNTAIAAMNSLLGM